MNINYNRIDLRGENVMKIFIDPGHGGRDHGATGHGMREKDLVLQISLYLRDILLNDYDGVDVRMSRDSDVYVGLSERARMANNWGADYFLSIHVNGGGGTGFESYVHSSMPQRTVELQAIIHDIIVSELNVRDRGKKSANFAVLRETTMSALLTENLFIDNANDAEKLSNDDFLRQIAQAHARGLEEAFNLNRSNSNSDMYRVIVDGNQVGAFREKQNILNQVDQHVGQADEILIQKVDN